MGVAIAWQRVAFAEAFATNVEHEIPCSFSGQEFFVTLILMHGTNVLGAHIRTGFSIFEAITSETNKHCT